MGIKDLEIDFLKDIDWEKNNVAEQIEKNAQESGQPYYVLCPWYDIDRAEDLKKFSQGREVSSHASSTSLVLRAIEKEGRSGDKSPKK